MVHVVCTYDVPTGDPMCFVSSAGKFMFKNAVQLNTIPREHSPSLLCRAGFYVVRGHVPVLIAPDWACGCVEAAALLQAPARTSTPSPAEAAAVARSTHSGRWSPSSAATTRYTFTCHDAMENNNNSGLHHSFWGSGYRIDLDRKALCEDFVVCRRTECGCGT